MIICPNCKHENLDGTVFCTDCATPLRQTDEIVTQNISEEEREQLAIASKMTQEISTDLDTWASLHLLESGQILTLADRKEFTLGRVSDAQPIMPDIDLTPYQAYACGVSRLHAVLRREGKDVFIKDLGSSNGTYLNGERLQPNSDHPLNHGDMLFLGKLKLQILLKLP